MNYEYISNKYHSTYVRDQYSRCIWFRMSHALVYAGEALALRQEMKKKKKKKETKKVRDQITLRITTVEIRQAKS